MWWPTRCENGQLRRRREIRELFKSNKVDSMFQMLPSSLRFSGVILTHHCTALIQYKQTARPDLMNLLSGQIGLQIALLATEWRLKESVRRYIATLEINLFRRKFGKWRTRTIHPTTTHEAGRDPNRPTNRGLF